MSVQALPAPGPPQPRLGEPPVELEPDSFAERLYIALAPLARSDEENDWALLILCNALGQMFQLVEDWARDSPDGPGWSLLVDLDRCPDEALPWLGQFVGVRVPSGGTPAEARAYIAAHSGFERGTPASIRAAAQATLTGEKTVVFRERDTDPYKLTVITYTDETPDSQATLQAILSQKPGGIVLNYVTNVGQDWLSLRTNQASWTQVKSRYPDWIAVVTDQPPA